jgi:outer membrane immunogenic protein
VKRLLTLLCLLSAPAFAADMPAKVASAAYMPASDPWTGFYLGANAGYGFDLGQFGFGPANITDLAGSPQGFVGGGQLGLGTRFGGQWYAGVEGDADGAAVSGSGAMPGVITVTSKNTFLASLRGRVGFILPNNCAMLYGTAGWGFGGGSFSVTDVAHGVNSTVSPTTNGVVWGGGVELALTSNWLARAEYLQYDFGSFNTSLPSASAVSFTQRDRVDVVRAGLSYKF